MISFLPFAAYFLPGISSMITITWTWPSWPKHVIKCIKHLTLTKSCCSWLMLYFSLLYTVSLYIIKTPCSLLNLKVHCHVQNSLPPWLILRFMNTGHALLLHHFKIHFNITSPKWSLSFQVFLPNLLTAFLISPTCTTVPAPHIS